MFIYNTFKQQMQHSFILINLCSQPRGALENALKGHASSIRHIHREQVVPLEQAMVISCLFGSLIT